MRDHGATKKYEAKRTAQGKSKREIIRCLKRYIVREICMPNDTKHTH
jgi:transposase